MEFNIYVSFGAVVVSAAPVANAMDPREELFPKYAESLGRYLRAGMPTVVRLGGVGDYDREETTLEVVSAATVDLERQQYLERAIGALIVDHVDLWADELAATA